MSWNFYNSDAQILQGVLAGSITSTELADNAVTSAKIVNATIVGNDIDDGVISAQKISAGAIGHTQMASAAINSQTAKTTVADADIILIGDSAASYALKKMTKANLTAGVGVGLGMVIALGG